MTKLEALSERVRYWEAQLDEHRKEQAVIARTSGVFERRAMLGPWWKIREDLQERIAWAKEDRNAWLEEPL